MSFWRNYVKMASFWRNNDVIVALLRNVPAGYLNPYIIIAWLHTYNWHNWNHFIELLAFTRCFNISVVGPDSHCCQNAADKILWIANKGLISNYVTQSSGCGGIDCPWVLEAPQGHLFNISLFDFNTYDGVSKAIFFKCQKSFVEQLKCIIFVNGRFFMPKSGRHKLIHYL